ncbi:MAG TPA: helix-turn-helix transcriptional regulator [Mucilaginibacter sp.]|jgi:transcriptional regulator with XRE-family HTH domain
MEKSRYNYNRSKEMLAAKGHSNKSLAEYLKVTETTVSTWCTNLRQPPIETFFEIAKFLEIDAGELVTPMKNLKQVTPKSKGNVKPPSVKTTKKLK